jgi:hypothetical protein
MNRTESIGLALYTTIAVGMDSWFLASRCEFSPPVQPLGTAVALLLQLSAISLSVSRISVQLADLSHRRTAQQGNPADARRLAPLNAGVSCFESPSHALRKSQHVDPYRRSCCRCYVELLGA